MDYDVSYDIINYNHERSQIGLGLYKSWNIYVLARAKYKGQVILNLYKNKMKSVIKKTLLNYIQRRSNTKIINQCPRLTLYLVSGILNVLPMWLYSPHWSSVTLTMVSVCSEVTVTTLKYKKGYYFRIVCFC